MRPVVPVVALCIVPAFGCAAPASDPVLAVYAGGEVTQSEYESYGGRRGAARRDPAQKLLDIALIESLANAALANDAASGATATLRLQGFEDRPWVKSLENRILAASEPGEEEILDYIDARRHQLEKPRKVRLWNIFKRAPGAEDAAGREAVRRDIEAIRRRALAGEDFNALARAESESVNRYRGGRMGAVPPGQLKPELNAAAFGLQEGEISPVIEVEGGFVILRNAGWVEARTMSEEEAIERVRSALRRQAFEAAWQGLRSELFEAAEVRFDDSLAPEAAAETPIASLDGETLTYGQIDGLARSLSGPQSGAQAQGPDTEEAPRLTDARIRAVFLELAFTRLAATKAREEGLEPDPADLAANRHLRNRYLAEAELERRARQQPIETTDADAEAFYRDNPRLFQIPDRSRISLIQLRLDGDDDTLVRKSLLGRQTVERIRSGRISFAAAAREVSEHPSAAQGGEVGWKPRRWAAGLGPNVLDALEALEPGQITDLVRQDHLWILELEAFEPGRALTLEEAVPAAHRGAAARELASRKTAAELAERKNVEETLRILALPPQDEDRPIAPSEEPEPTPASEPT